MKLKIAPLATGMTLLAACASGSPSQPAPFTRSSDTGFVEHFIPYEGQRIYAREWPGAEPAIVLMHGFPDDLHLYDQLVQGFFERFLPAFASFRSLNASREADVATRTARVDRLKTFEPRVQIVFGADDPYLNKGVAQSFHELFRHSELTLIDGAAHYVQVDAPSRVAQALMN